MAVVPGGLKGRSIFVSYCHGYRPENVRSIADRLKEHGFHVWIDRDKLKDELYEDIHKGIDACDLFLMFFNDKYIASDNCKAEATYALTNQKKPTLAVNMDGKMPTQSWLAFILRSRLWIDFSNEYESDHVLEQILERIRRHFDTNSQDGADDWLEVTTEAFSFERTNVPNFSSSGYYSRPEDEEKIFEQLVGICETPGNGFLVVAGDGGVGKTTMLSRLFLERKPTTETTYVFWLNCFRWSESFDDAAEKSFSEELIRLAKLADPSFNAIDPGHIIPFFKAKKNRHVLFLLDDVFNVNLLRSFIAMQKDASQLSCCAITRDPFPIAMESLDKTVIRVDALTTSGIKMMLEDMYHLKEKLSEEKIAKLAESCCGLPLIASLIAAKFKMAKNYDFVYERLFKEELKNLAVVNKEKRSFATVSQLLGFSLEQLTEEDRVRYFAFLFFDPAEPVSSEDLAIFWKCETMEACEIVESFKQRSLARSAENTSSQVEDCALVHQMLWEAAVEKAACHFQLKTDSREEMVNKIRFNVLMQSKDCEMVMFEAVRRMRPSVLKLTINKMIPTDLTALCLQPSRCRHGESSITFIHFVYKYGNNLPKNIDTETLNEAFRSKSNHSYRLIRDILLKLKTAPGDDGNQLLLGIANAGSTVEDSFLMNLFDDHEAGGTTERQPLVTIMWPFRAIYLENSWKQQQLSSQETPRIVKAAINGDLASVKSLLDKDIWSALWAAARCGHLEIVQYLTKKPDLKLTQQRDSAMGFTPINVAARNGHLAIVKWLAKLDPASLVIADNGGWTPLLSATRYGHLEIVQFLAEQNPQLLTMSAEDGWTPLLSACKNNHLAIVKFIFSRDQWLLEDNDEALYVACAGGHHGIVKFLVEEMKIRLTDPTCLIAAASHGYLPVVKLLLQNGLSCRGSGNWTTLHAAAKYGHLEIVRFLLADKEASKNEVSMQDSVGQTPLFVAAANGHLDIVKVLVDQDSNLARVADIDGAIALHEAAANGFLEIVQFLAESDSLSIKARTETKDKWLPLHSAASRGHLDTVLYLAGRLLALASSDSSTESLKQDFETAMKSADSRGHSEIVDCLRTLLRE